MTEPFPIIDKSQARASFEKAADSYDGAAVLQRQTAEEMLERLELVKLQPEVILDIGCGTGEATAALSKRYKKAKVIALDFAHAMLKHTRRRGSSWLKKQACVCADAEQLPLADASVDLIFSNATIQWCNDLERTFAGFLRVLKPGGLIMFSSFGPDTLTELRQAWAAVDGTSHVSPFLDMHDVGDALLRVGFADPVMDVERMTLTYPDVKGLMRDLKQIGAHNVTADRHRGLTGKGRMLAMTQAYEQFRRDGQLPASYEVVHGHAWVPEMNQQVRDGSVMVSLDPYKPGS